TKAALPAMTSRRWGRIIMVASVTGPVMAMRGDAAYATAKAGMVGLTRAAAIDAAGHGITVNAVAPGWIATGSQTPQEHEEGLATDPPELLRLGAAGEAVGQEDGAGRGVPEGGQQRQLRDGRGHLVVAFLHAEVPGQAAAPGQGGDRGPGRRQQRPVRAVAH